MKVDLTICVFLIPRFGSDVCPKQLKSLHVIFLFARNTEISFLGEVQIHEN